MNSSINRARVHNVSRIYNTGKAAAAAIGISSVHYHRLCREYGIETPAQRRQREKIEQIWKMERRRYQEEASLVRAEVA